MNGAADNQGDARLAIPAKVTSVPEYWALASLKSRCYLPHHPQYNSYGGRGIGVCDRWRYGDGSLTAFECFWLDMGPRPSKQYSIDRINNDGHYEPSNCRWATRIEQNRNRRDNHIVEINGERLPLVEAVERFGRAKPTTISARIGYGYSEEAAVLTPAFDLRRLPHGAKLSEDQVRAIFSDQRHHSLVAAEHGISSGAVWGIKSGRSWAYLRLKDQAAKAGGRR